MVFPSVGNLRNPASATTFLGEEQTPRRPGILADRNCDS
ncbi:hypothetical protein THTE_2203 [Thermogutta terrifontis]|uniref:Uncharacterized protein n=1 Tax=Thermogutta terrifontis TaxID=1331910 RepID=A0A286RFS1_9BACT|nr:hypothetical protein THTE_2203 [Thermogutta terrifontis]